MSFYLVLKVVAKEVHERPFTYLYASVLAAKI